MKASFFILLLAVTCTACVVNPDADKALRDGWQSKDSTAAVEPGVVQPTPDTGQYAMPVAPIAPGDMPVVNPVNSGAGVPK